MRLTIRTATAAKREPCDLCAISADKERQSSSQAPRCGERTQRARKTTLLLTRKIPVLSGDECRTFRRRMHHKHVFLFCFKRPLLYAPRLDRPHHNNTRARTHSLANAQVHWHPWGGSIVSLDAQSRVSAYSNCSKMYTRAV